MWSGGFPVEITLTPQAFTAAFKAGLKNHESPADDTIGADRAGLLASLADWKRAIDEAEAALAEHP
jgi:hypothetical protein